jgi:hypothetical protein
MISLGILLVGLVALFVISVVCRPSWSHGSGCSDDARERWRRRLFRAEYVKSEHLTGCTSGGEEIRILKIIDECTLEIAPAESRSRKLVIEVGDAPIELTRITNADGRRITVRAKLERGKPKDILFGKDRELITLSCPAGLACTAVIKLSDASPR